jgi:hypothetical protein
VRQTWRGRPAELQRQRAGRRHGLSGNRGRLIAWAVNIVPNWHDKNGYARPFSKDWKGRFFLMKCAAERPFADPDTAARKLIEIANSAEAYMDGRIPIEVINGPFLRAGGSARSLI